MRSEAPGQLSSRSSAAKSATAVLPSVKAPPVCQLEGPTLPGCAGLLLQAPDSPDRAGMDWAPLQPATRQALVVSLQRLLPPTLMVPDGRLEQLLEQALDAQVLLHCLGLLKAWGEQAGGWGGAAWGWADAGCHGRLLQLKLCVQRVI